MLGRWFLFNHLWAVTRLSLSSHRTVVVWQLEASMLTLEPVKLHPLLKGCAMGSGWVVPGGWDNPCQSPPSPWVWWQRLG